MNILRLVKVIELRLRNSPKLYKHGKRIALLLSGDMLYNGRQLLDDYSTSGRVLKFNNFGDLNRDTPIYHISYGVYNKETCGFFGMLNTCLKYLVFADFYGLTPVIEWNNTIYSEKDNYRGTNNTFEYYFEPISKINTMDVKHSAYVYPALFGDTTIYNERSISDDDKIKQLAGVCNKYIKLKKDINEAINCEMRELGIGENVLGVQLRGTDAKTELFGHPKYIGVEQYFEEIDRIIDQYEQIFLATEDSETYEMFLKRYGLRVIYYPDVTRSTKCSIDVSKDAKEYGDKYKLGYEVLRDAISLSHCGGLVCGPYNVPFFSRIEKAKMNQNYKHCIVLDNGVSLKNNYYTKELI